MHTRNMTRTNELKNVYLHSYNSRNATNISTAQIQLVNCMKIKNKKIGLKPSLTKKRTTLLRNITDKIETNENYRDTVKFCYSDFNGNIKVRLHELHKGKYVHTITNLNKIETLVEEITNNEH